MSVSGGVKHRRWTRYVFQNEGPDLTPSSSVMVEPFNLSYFTILAPDPMDPGQMYKAWKQFERLLDRLGTCFRQHWHYPQRPEDVLPPTGRNLFWMPKIQVVFKTNGDEAGDLVVAGNKVSCPSRILAISDLPFKSPKSCNSPMTPTSTVSINYYSVCERCLRSYSGSRGVGSDGMKRLSTILHRARHSLDCLSRTAIFLIAEFKRASMFFTSGWKRCVTKYLGPQPPDCGLKCA